MITGSIQTKAGEVRQVASRLNTSDIMGAVKVRWNIGRNHYTVEPGLYAVGNPDDTSDVFVTANYKLSFDHLRKNLDGISAWILVLDTKGINVWCAAGKGTFGTAELVNRIKQVQLDSIINHRRIIVPQLGATGVSAHQVKALTSSAPAEQRMAGNANPASDFKFNSGIKISQGFNVIFGPVRAADIKKFIRNGYKASPAMRKVEFTLSDRIKLTPVDIVYARYKLLGAFALIFLLAGLNSGGISFIQAAEKGLPAMLNITLAYLTGIVITPILLPWIPVRMFGFKGLITGFILATILFLAHMLGESWSEIVSWFLLIPGISSFMAMNFTGSSTFTSLSGVKKEMRVFVPVQIILAVAGLFFFVFSSFQSIN
jgi:hypothetical protein